jgi:predicted NAD/FAD-binding protein
MTAKTSQHLADVLRAAGFDDLAERAERAETDEFHDFLSNHTFPDLVLDTELAGIARDTKRDERQRTAAYHIRMRHHEGEFDASLEESDEWAASTDGQAAYAELTRELKK